MNVQNDENMFSWLMSTAAETIPKSKFSKIEKIIQNNSNLSKKTSPKMQTSTKINKKVQLMNFCTQTPKPLKPKFRHLNP